MFLAILLLVLACFISLLDTSLTVTKYFLYHEKHDYKHYMLIRVMYQHCGLEFCLYDRQETQPIYVDPIFCDLLHQWSSILIYTLNNKAGLNEVSHDHCMVLFTMMNVKVTRTLWPTCSYLNACLRSWTGVSVRRNKELISIQKQANMALLLAKLLPLCHSGWHDRRSTWYLLWFCLSYVYNRLPLDNYFYFVWNLLLGVIVGTVFAWYTARSSPCLKASHVYTTWTFCINEGVWALWLVESYAILRL